MKETDLRTSDFSLMRRRAESAIWRPSHASVRRKEVPDIAMLSTAVPAADPESSPRETR